MAVIAVPSLQTGGPERLSFVPKGAQLVSSALGVLVPGPSPSGTIMPVALAGILKWRPGSESVRPVSRAQVWTDGHAWAFLKSGRGLLPRFGAETQLCRGLWFLAGVFPDHVRLHPRGQRYAEQLSPVTARPH